MTLRLVHDFATPAALVAAAEQELSKRGLLVRGAEVGQSPPMTPCSVELRLAGVPFASVPARVAAVVPGVGVAVMFEALPPEVGQAVERARAGQPVLAEPAPEPEMDEADEPVRGTVAERLKALSVAEKIALALNCDRETRFALLRDHNKMLHQYVLRNPRLGLDEVLAAAKLASLSPDALKGIAEHKDWGHNPQICTALVRNPKMLLPIALRLLERIPQSEVRAIAKGGARDQLVQAARKRLSS